MSAMWATSFNHSNRRECRDAVKSRIEGIFGKTIPDILTTIRHRCFVELCEAHGTSVGKVTHRGAVLTHFLKRIGARFL